MTKFIIALFILTFPMSAIWGQSSAETNLGLEKVSKPGELPDKWWRCGTPNYIVKVDDAIKNNGNNSITVELNGEPSENSFGCALSSIPANFGGNEVELKAFVKLKDVGGVGAGILLRIDGDDGALKFYSMTDNPLLGTADWKEYSIKLSLPEDSKQIIFGIINSGNGKIWADDFQILVDGKEISQAPAKKLPPAKLDKEFDSGSKIGEISINSAKSDDLAVLGKVWGFLKYHHPAIAKGKYNWDYELFRVLPKILASKNKKKRNEVLNEWIKSLGEFEKGEIEKIETANIKLKPDFFWINEKALGSQLTKSLEEVKSAKRLNSHYYIGLVQNVNNPIFKNEEPYKSMSYPDTGFRLLGLFRFWNIIQYYFPNKHLIGEDWNKVLSQFIPQFVSAKNELEYKKASLKLINSIHDTHANIWSQDETLEKFRGLNFAPAIVTFIENKAVVTNFWEPSLGDKSGLRIGDIIESINGKTVAQIIVENLDYNPASNYPAKLRNIARHLLRTNEATLKIKFRRGEESKEIEVECFPNSKMKVNLFADTHKPIPAFKLISPEIAYLYPGSLKQGEIENLKPHITKTKGLIIDLRSYPSDFIVFSLGEFLLPRATDFVKFSKGSIKSPGLFTFEEGEKLGKENSEYYKGKVVILINETSLSQAEYTTMAFRVAPRAIVIGSTTAGADGNVSGFSLPGGIRTAISGIGVYYPDGKETQRIGIVPDIEFKPTIKGIREGRDEMLDKAIEVINQSK